MKPTDEALLAALTRHATGPTPEAWRVTDVRATPLLGGYVSKTVDRLDLTLATDAGQTLAAAFVRKGCTRREILALAAVGELPGAPAAPEVILAWSSPERPDDVEANGFASPFYPGGDMKFGDPMPQPVLATLASLHARCADPATLAWTWAFDATVAGQMRANALTALTSSASFRARTPDHAHWLARLERAGCSPALEAASERLRRTLTHGDMHPGNIIRRRDGAPMIIDWGNACLATPMLDLANMATIGSAQWRFYLSAYRAAGGDIDEPDLRRGYWWARAVTGLMYVPWAAEHTERTPALILQVEEAEARLAELGDGSASRGAGTGKAHAQG